MYWHRLRRVRRGDELADVQRLIRGCHNRPFEFIATVDKFEITDTEFQWNLVVHRSSLTKLQLHNKATLYMPKGEGRLGQPVALRSPLDALTLEYGDRVASDGAKGRFLVRTFRNRVRVVILRGNPLISASVEVQKLDDGSWKRVPKIRD
jgi:hypothetical protein